MQAALAVNGIFSEGFLSKFTRQETERAISLRAVHLSGKPKKGYAHDDN